MTKGRNTTYEERVEIVSYCIEHGNDYTATIEKYGVSYFDFWESRKEILFLLGKNGLLPRLFDYVYRHGESIFTAVRTSETAKEYAQSLPYLLAYSIGGMHSMLIKWVESGMTVPSMVLVAQLRAGFQSPEL